MTMKNFSANFQKIVLLFVFISLISTIAFGIFAVEHSATHGQDCLASKAESGNPCPINSISLLLHHLAALRIFSVPLPLTSAVFSFALFLFTLVFVSTRGWPARLSPRLLAVFFQKGENTASFQKLPFLYWFAMTERSPSFN